MQESTSERSTTCVEIFRMQICYDIYVILFIINEQAILSFSYHIDSLIIYQWTNPPNPSPTTRQKSVRPWLKWQLSRAGVRSRKLERRLLFFQFKEQPRGWFVRRKRRRPIVCSPRRSSIMHSRKKCSLKKWLHSTGTPTRWPRDNFPPREIST